MTLSEADVEAAALVWFKELGYAVLAGSQLAPGEPSAERQAFSDVVLAERLRAAIQRLNPAIPKQAREGGPAQAVAPVHALLAADKTAPFTACCGRVCRWNTPGLICWCSSMACPSA